MVRATLPVTMKGTILSQSELYKSNMQKQFGIKQVKLSETQLSAPPGGYGDDIGTNGNFLPFYRRFDQ